MTSKLILATDNHPLAQALAGTDYDILEVDSQALYELSPNDFENREMILDFTVMDTDSKAELLLSIENYTDAPIFSDTTINWGDYLVKNISSLTTCFAGAFYSPNQTVEVSSRDDHSFELMTNFLKEIGLKSKRVEAPGICFTYPRIISMIINEAHFAKDENLATDESLDTAMKYGVNYPLGPIEWSEKIEPIFVYHVLTELYKVTEDSRYRVSKSLKLKI
ncbi:3-hydroxyacyl-CoA dehydrogenase family protein [Bacteriovorax sp. Seq25_V]|uniref:3-hydroxyacyl-CoA dehydrogenase family protein n=1 Tax=Bacteriovorax sp. Seq25_V TaxID=1201288 RepID=UPI00038A02DA|nr:3-hydroxyacyl-CoA dehydrogenase family protein [Bacteriovorax sp. Seq25_V]EQC43702.1 3-hydroxyacyl-CoA dehydrogenase, C-terminal domain protein [Bacteriovorax sp. Seq25_V]